MRVQLPTAAVLALLTLPLVFSGCTTATTGPTSNVPFSQVDLRIGDGAVALTTSTITAHYTGWIYSPTALDQKGLVFDTSAGKDPITVMLGAAMVIAGWDEGIPGMKVGGVRRLVIPPGSAYGSTRVASLPPNATLIFEITLVGVQ